MNVQAMRQSERYTADELAKDITDKLGDAPEITLSDTLVLVAIFTGKEMTKGGIIIPDKAMRENVYQGKAGLVLKVGPMAYKDGTNYAFGGFAVKAGDWVAFRPAECEMHLQIKGYDCRIFEDQRVRIKLEHPQDVY